MNLDDRSENVAATPWRRVGLIYGCGLLAAGQLGVVPPIVPALQEELGIGLTTAGLAISLITCVGAALGLAAGGWAERIGHARAVVAGLAIMTLAAALCAMAEGGAMRLRHVALPGSATFWWLSPRRR